jgi:outer membrane protein assembly factor BamB
VYLSSPAAALDLETGTTVWEARWIVGGSGGVALSDDGETVYLGRLDPAAGGEVVALVTGDGSVAWRTPLGQTALSLLERPWVAGDVLVIPTLSGSALGLDTRTGEIKWQAVLPAARFGSLTVEGDQAYMALSNGQMAAVSTKDGEVTLRGGDTEGGLEGYAFAQRPLLFADRIVAAFGSSIRGYSRVEGAR